MHNKRLVLFASNVGLIGAAICVGIKPNNQFLPVVGCFIGWIVAYPIYKFVSRAEKK